MISRARRAVGLMAAIVAVILAFAASPALAQTYTISPGTFTNCTPTTFTPLQIPAADNAGPFSVITITPNSSYSFLEFVIDGGNPVTTGYTAADGTYFSVSGSSISVSNVQGNHTVGAVCNSSLTITVIDPVNGTISPSANQTVPTGGSVQFTESAALGYQYASWVIDSKAVTATATLTDGTVATIAGSILTLTNVSGAHSVSVAFTALPEYTITPQPTSGGTISPGAAQGVQEGGSITFTAAGTAGNGFASWTADTTALVVGANTLSDKTVVTVAVTYSSGIPSSTAVFSNVQGSHTISAAFGATPTVSGVSPNYAYVGNSDTTVTINGSNYVSGSVVNWNSTATGTPATTTALTTTFVSSTQLTAVVPAADLLIASSTAFTLTVTSPGQGTSAPVAFTVYNDVPILTSMSPSSCVLGGIYPYFVLTVTGTGFSNNATNTTSGSVIQWNGTNLKTTYISATSLSAQIPPSYIHPVGQIPVTVVNPTPNGTSQALVSNPLAFTIVPVDPPTISSINPTSVMVNSPETTIIVTGSAFISGLQPGSSDTKVQWNGTTLATSMNTSGQLVATVPASDLTTVGTYTITATNGGTLADGTPNVSNGVPFQVTNVPVPTLSSVTPSSGMAGTPAMTITLTGTNFIQETPQYAGSEVYIQQLSGTTPVGSPIALTTTYDGGSTLQALVTQGLMATPGTFNIYVYNPGPGGGESNTLPFAVTNPTPTITNLNPNFALINTNAVTVTLTGTNFTANTVVAWNGTTLASTYVSATVITAVVPAADLTVAGTYDITATNPDESGASAPTTFEVQYPTPALTNISPGVAAVGSTATTITLTGSNFGNYSLVEWNGTQIPTTYVSATSLSAVIPVSDLLAATTAAITVLNPTPGGGTSNTLSFTVSYPTPTITSISPTLASPGASDTTITVTGTGYIANSVVDWGGTPLVTTYVSSTEVTAVVPAADLTTAGNYDITIVNPVTAGGTSNYKVFSVANPVPTVTEVAPSSVIIDSPAVTLTVTGSGFISTSTVDWNGTPLATTYVSTTSLTAVVPATNLTTAGSYVITVVTPAPGGGTSNSIDFTVIDPTPTISNISPSATAVGSSATTITVTGTGFSPNAVVDWNGVALPSTYVSGTEMTATIPPTDLTSIGIYYVTVVNPNAKVSAASDFTVFTTGVISIALKSSSVYGGTTDLCTVTLGANVTSGNATITLTSSDPTNFPVPSSLTVPAGSSSGSFIVQTHRVTTPETVTITASYDGSAAANMLVKPASNGALWNWGVNSYGQLGNGSTTPTDVPVQVSDVTGIALSGGGTFSMTLRQDGTVWAWGYNGDGELGNGTLANSSIPVQVSDLNGINYISAGFSHSLALRQDGTVWAWGYNADGELGNGSTTNSAVPVQIDTSILSNVTAVSSGQLHSLALRNDGTVWAWGSNTYGQLGNGTTASSSIPQRVSGLTGVVAIAAGNRHSLALRNDGTVWAWGYNSDGELGNESNTNSSTPTEVSGLTGVIAIATSSDSFHSMALMQGGTVVTWGWNNDGQLGNGTSSGSSNVPVSVTGISNVTGIAVGALNCMALVSGGTLSVWGYSGEGGEGTGQPYDETNVPVQVSSLSNVIAVNSGTYTYMAVTSLQPFDLTGDGYNDLLWYNSALGGVMYWTLDGPTPTGTSGIITEGVSSDWQVVAQADVVGDGWPDLIWQSQSTGAVVYWQMNGVTPVGDGWITANAAGWSVACLADMNGDGWPDIIWQNNTTGAVVCWLMNGSTFTGSSPWITASVASGWHVVGAVDLNGDGYNDLVWWNSNTGDVCYWLMNGTTAVGSGYIAASVDTDWHLVGLEDLNGDGSPDLIWQSKSTGAVVCWFMDGATPTGESAWLTSMGPSGWKVAGMR